MTVDSAISTYVNVGSFVAGSSETGTITAAGDEGISAIDYNLPTLSYTASKPSTFAEYETMLSALSGKVITFSFNCTFAEN